VEDLKKQGVIFIEELDEIKDKSRPVIFSAHGVPKSVPDSAKIKKIFFIDAICPLVSKVHKEAEQLVLTFEYDVLYNPTDEDLKSDEFRNIIGDILLEVIDASLEHDQIKFNAENRNSDTE